MPPVIEVYLEVGAKRVFAGAIDWPGWCRRGRDEGGALDALAAYGPRYRKALARRGRGFSPRGDASSFAVIERLRGDASTDFGVPGKAPTGDDRLLDGPELERQTGLLQACWAAFDGAAERAVGAELRKGPRGGGRELDAIVRHVLDAEEAYLRSLGGKAGREADVDAAMALVRGAFLETLEAHARGEPPPQSPRRTSKLWSPRYAVRRSAWHALDHAWEIEDRSIEDPTGSA